MGLAVSAEVAAAAALIVQLVLVALVVAPVFLGDAALDDVLPLLAGALALLLLRAGLGVIGEIAARRAAASLVGRVRAEVTAQLLLLGPTYRSRSKGGELASTLTVGLETLDEYVSAFVPARWSAMLVPPLVLLAVLALDPASVVVLLLTGPLLLLLLGLIGGRTRAVTQRRFLEMRALSAFFLDILRGIATLKLFGRSREQAGTLRVVSGRYGDTTMEVLRTAFQTSLVLEWGATVAIALVAVEIGLRLLADAVPFERALAVLLITPEFFLPLRQLAVRFHVGTAGTAVIERVNGILDEPLGTPAQVQSRVEGRATPAAPGWVGTATPAPGRRALTAAPRIRYDAVLVTYPGRASPALDELTLELPAGLTTAIVGPTGAGKTTLANLLLRFLDPQKGHIRVDDRDMAAIDVGDWRASIAWVPQRTHLFHGSIAENIRLARPDASDVEVAEAARAANAEGFIRRLRGGFEAPVGEGGLRLSGGQRQRIAIARAFLRDAPLLILDEPTSQQDELSEGAVADVLDRLVKGRTVLVISHRLGLAERADRVAVLVAGGVVEIGPPDLLRRRGGAFAALLEAGARNGSAAWDSGGTGDHVGVRAASEIGPRPGTWPFVTPAGRPG